MPNMSLKKYPMPEQEPASRATNFKEVAWGYIREITMEEAERCLHCMPAPCVTGCPVNNVPIPCVDGSDIDVHPIDWDEVIARRRMFRPEEAQAKEKLHQCRRDTMIENAVKGGA